MISERVGVISVMVSAMNYIFYSVKFVCPHCPDVLACPLCIYLNDKTDSTAVLLGCKAFMQEFESVQISGTIADDISHRFVYSVFNHI